MIKRIGAFTLLALLLIGAAGLIYEALASATARRNFPPPGELTEVGGYRLHLHSQGAKPAGAPTVLLEHGGGGMSAQWGWIQPALARHTQVVAYDRPGMGWSEPPPALLDAEEAARAFYAALQSAGIEGPYILVGHSLGGIMVRVFARLYPDDTAGLVLIDPVTVERHELLPYGMDAATLGVVQTLARLGAVRLIGMASQDAAGLPEPYYSQAITISPGYPHIRHLRQEGQLGESGMAFLRQGETLEKLPLIVLEAGAPGEGFDADQRAVLHELYTRLAARSAQGELRLVPDAGHATIVTQEANAQAVIAAVIELLAMGDEG